MTTELLTVMPDQNRAAWLEDRRSRIGASEAAAALGLSPFESPRELYLRKIGELPDADENEAMVWGRLLEPAIAAEYGRRTGNAVTKVQLELRADDGVTPLGATLDGLTEGGWPLEIKTVSAWSSREIGDEGTDDLPEHWLLQAHQQMYLAKADRVDFAVLIGGQRLEIRPVHRNEALVGRMLLKLGEFWGHVLRREPPSATARRDERLMHLIYPDCDGEVDLSDEVAGAVDRWQELATAIKGAEEMRSAAKAAILEALGNARVGTLPDGRIVTRKITEVAEKQVTRKGYTFVDLRVRKGGAK